MIYILYNQKSVTYAPEIKYGDGANLLFKTGFFIFDTENNDGNFYIDRYRNNVEIHGDIFAINDKLIFNNPIKAELICLRLQIEESKKCSFDFFLPNKFKKYVDRYNYLKQEYPEYII